MENGFARGYVRDPVPPIATNFQTTTTNSEQWSSIVFHCPGKIGKIVGLWKYYDFNSFAAVLLYNLADGSRILCAAFDKKN